MFSAVRQGRRGNGELKGMHGVRVGPGGNAASAWMLQFMVNLQRLEKERDKGS